MLSTKPINTNISVGVRNKIQVTELRQKHLKLFKLENLEISPRFIPKSAYIPRGESERFLSFYPSELEPGTDIYTEFVSSTLEPEDPERRLYKWLFNAEFKTEYATTEPHPRTGDVRYLIPIGELIDVASLHLEVKKPSEPIQVEKQLSLDIPTTSGLLKTISVTAAPILLTIEDAPINQMTIKDKAAIDWKLPVSDKLWLNKLITDNFKVNG